jgi:chromosome segregation ATPase
MATQTKRKQHLNVNATQMEIPPAGKGISEDFEGKLEDAQAQLEYLHKQREQLERQKTALEELNQRKQEFLNGQIDLSERLSNAVTTIDRELFDSKQEIEDMGQARESFSNHLKRIENLNSEAWSKEALKEELEKALGVLERAEDEYHQAIDHFSGTRRGQGIFGAGSSRAHHPTGDFSSMMKQGFAFNLPLLVLGALALLVYLLK